MVGRLVGILREICFDAKKIPEKAHMGDRLIVP